MKRICEIRSRSWRKIYEGFCMHVHSINYVVNRHSMYQRQALECIKWMEKQGIKTIEKAQANDVFNYVEYIKTRPKKN